jgi:hypothetical protein
MIVNDESLQSRRDAYGDPPRSVYQCRITIATGSQLEFAKLQEYPASGDALISSGYDLEAPPMPKHLGGFFTKEKWKNDLEEPVRKTLAEANQKRAQLSSVLIRNYRVPWFVKISFFMSRCSSNLPTIFNLIVSLLVAPVIVLIFVPSGMLSTICITRNSEAEKQWMRDQLKDIPHLETVAIETQIVSSLKDIANKLTRDNAPALKVEYSNGKRHVSNGSNGGYAIEEFTLLFQIRQSGFQGDVAQNVL